MPPSLSEKNKTNRPEIRKIFRLLSAQTRNIFRLYRAKTRNILRFCGRKSVIFSDFYHPQSELVMFHHKVGKYYAFLHPKPGKYSAFPLLLSINPENITVLRSLIRKYLRLSGRKSVKYYDFSRQNPENIPTLRPHTLKNFRYPDRKFKNSSLSLLCHPACAPRRPQSIAQPGPPPLHNSKLLRLC